jgi:Aminoglycoside/hydroxyurea antibiotic resistance kinase
LSWLASTASTAARLAAISAAECCKYNAWAWCIIRIRRLETPLAPEIIRIGGRYRPEWHHHPANAVEYGLIMFRIRRSIRFMPSLHTRKGPLHAGYARKAPVRTFAELTPDDVAATLRDRQRALCDPVPARWLAMAVDLAATLSRDPERRLVHADLHYENVLASERPGAPWVAIDPDAATGAPERSVAELLWTRADELPDSGAITGLVDVLVEHGRLDRAKALAWAFVRSIDYWLWGLDNGLTVDPQRCRRIVAALAPELPP